MILKFKNFINLHEEEKIDILEIRNSKYVRENMSNDNIIEKDAHFNWIENLVNDQNSKYFAIFFDNKLQGSVYFNINQQECFWGIYLDEGSSAIISSLSAYIFLEFLINTMSIQKIFSSVKKKNSQALNFNKNFGFEIFKEDEDFFYLKLSKEIWENSKKSRLLKPIKRYLDKIEYYFE
ncbi:GNAT family N-acetyltransferase [Aliarcobacter cryaerophilus]|uniref:GNAT family N-acetyltransferase n=1 Tax=Aliarcobacter cryaerophilus TaxID=28198 RepID=UPI0021B550F5|nr:GNAT family N-acetyltransferase [Aliarcobacter cryaerophilus]MCT7528325.1 GNAT family N-acetyltransferase [Aliarcobacter cryaerophilus]